jgi:hypothetical protein
MQEATIKHPTNGSTKPVVALLQQRDYRATYD